MSHGKKGGNRFSESQLIKLGYYQDAQGNWSRVDSQNRAEQPQDGKLEQNAGNGSERQNRPQRKRKSPVCHGYRYRLIVTSYRSVLIDPSNACYKAIEDCLVTNGYLPDDSPQYCDQPLLIQHKVKKVEERTGIELLRYKV